ncbi:MAG: 30S ribosomal protein S19 [Nanoarchaeota archaeon]
MAKKEFAFRGKSLEELKKMGREEFAQLLTARKRRTLLRGSREGHKRFMEKLKKKQDGVKTHCRDLIITPELVGKTIKLHRGKEFDSIMVQPEMIGHYLGEFSFSKKRVAHSNPGVGATKSSSNVSVK